MVLEGMNLQRSPNDGTISHTQWAETRAKAQAEAINRSTGNQTYYDCPICNNKGYVAEASGDAVILKKCSCMAKRKSLERIKKSGLEDLLRRCTFANFDPSENQAMYNKALEYAEAPKGWLYVCGKPGTGKTHICTAVCSSFIDSGRSTRYMVWRRDAPRLKSLITDAEAYYEAMEEFESADVLYIDDLFKGDITKADMNLAFELINARYNKRDAITIISTECSIEDILSLDEALGSRIYERSKGNCIRTSGRNRRL